MPSPRSFFLSLLLLLSPLALAQVDPNADYSWSMVGGNLQRNGQANPKTTMLQNPNMTWAFLDPNGQELMFVPIYDYVNDVVWTVSGDGFVYQVNATTGNMTYEICVGKQPAFPGDPCGNVNFDDRTMGQLTLLTSRDVILMYQQDSDAPDVMVRISREEGNVVWALELYNDTVDPSGNSHFMSLPTVINGINPANKSADVILVWVLNINSTDDSLRATYTMIDADTGAVILERPWLTPQQVLFPPPTVDPEDGNVISQFTNDVQPACGEDYEQFFLCTGIGKFETLTGEHIWNNTMGQSYSNGLVAIFNGIVQVSTTQLDAYSYFTKNGQGRWQIPETTSTYDQFWPAVCPDGTVIFPDNGQYIQGWGPQVVRPKKDKFWVGCNGPCALVPAVTMDGNFYMMEGNTLVSHSCKDGSVNWSRYFGDTDAETWPVAIGYEAVYINAYKPGTGGALVKMVDTGASDFKQHELVW